MGLPDVKDAIPVLVVCGGDLVGWSGGYLFSGKWDRWENGGRIRGLLAHSSLTAALTLKRFETLLLKGLNCWGIISAGRSFSSVGTKTIKHIYPQYFT